MSAVENVADVLDAAADIIIESGWTQGAFEDNGCFCLDGAIMRAKGVYDTLLELDYVRRATGWPSAIMWNDAPGRTEDEVVAKLREAAALARQEQAA